MWVRVVVWAESIRTIRSRNPLMSFYIIKSSQIVEGTNYYKVPSQTLPYLCINVFFISPSVVFQKRLVRNKKNR